MIPELEQKYQQLSEPQKEIFCGYGLRQVKHFVELSLPRVEAVLPGAAGVQGINSHGKIQALDAVSGKSYVWDEFMWVEQPHMSNQGVDQKADFIAVWQAFALDKMDLIDLSHIHRDFLKNNQCK
ncbi:hypothetical protein [Acinetobacter sp. WZC-1]|uniref:hypothetical protein n=1 Tax=Acinetobacter sp. WZC-1 TaxID=3459034 RepID=UPI00403E0016